MTPDGPKKQWWSAAPALITAFVLCCAAGPLHAAEEEARVLVLWGVDPYLPPYLAMDKAMRESLSREASGTVHFFSESLDTQRVALERIEPEIVALLAKKYDALRVSVVVAVSRTALDLFKRHGAQLFNVASDPGMPYGSAPNPKVVFERMPGFRITLYASPDDKALSTSGWLFGSIFRLGRINQASLTPDQLEHARSLGFLDVIQVQGTTDLIGHSYFVSNPEVSSDLIALLRYGLGPGNPGRGLVEIEKPFWRIPERQGAGAAH